MDLFSVATFLFFTLLVAVIAWVKTRHEDLSHGTGYFLAGRSLGTIVIAGSLILTNISTEQMVGMNGNAYANGVSVMAFEVIAVIAMVAMAWFFLPRYLSRGISTIPEYIALRFGDGIRVLVSIVTVLLLVTSFLPFILYSGALFFESYFNVSEQLGLSKLMTLYILCTAIGLLGGAYSILGGLKAVAVSDTINGVGLLIGGLAIPFLALMKLGEGSIVDGIVTLGTVHPERLSPLPDPANPAAVPFSALLTGMLLTNISYWCMGQFIVQRTFAARSMKDGQKGILLAAALKLVGVLMLVLPGLVAFHILGPDLDPADSAYPVLVKLILPQWLTGFFAAVVLGAILSSFNSALHVCSTMAALDIYKTALNKQAADTSAVNVGKLIGLVLMVFSILTAPLILNFGEGLYASMKIIGSIIGGPLAALTFAAIFMPKVSGRASVLALILGMAIQTYFIVLFPEQTPFQMHWLNFTFVNFLLALVVMVILSSTLMPQTHPMPEHRPGPVDMTWSRIAIPAGVLLLLAVVMLYGGLWWLTRDVTVATPAR